MTFYNIATGQTLSECDFYTLVSETVYDCCSQSQNVWIGQPNNLTFNEYQWQQWFVANPPECGSAFTLTLIYTTGNAPSQTLGQWNTQLGGNFTGVSVVGDNVLLTGGSNVTMTDYALVGAVQLTEVTDDGSVVALGEGVFDTCGLQNVSLPSVASVGPVCFRNNTSLSQIALPACNDLGGSSGDDGVFDGIVGNTITATFRASQQTIDGGNPDGDIVELDSSNTCTINYV